MDEFQDYKVLSCEGRDHTGKGDALNYLFSKLEEEGIDVLTASFPVYGTPIGNTIRELLTNGKEKFDLTAQEDLEVKMSLFALNRLEFLEAFLAENIDDDTLILFDRSAFSNALTIAYGIKDNADITEEEMEALVKTALELDSLLIEKLDLKNCVIQLDTGEQVWKSARGGGDDLHEVPEVQRLASGIYDIYKRLVGDGWKVVFTKEFDEEKGEQVWRDRADIFKDIYSFLIKRFDSVGSRKGRGRRGEIGIKEIMKSIYIGSKVDEDLLDAYVGSIRDNNKDVMYASSVGVKEQICSSYEAIRFENEEVKGAFREILDRYPKVAYVLECNLGENYILKLQEALFNE